ncbi:glycosyltransferase family 4 protein [Mucilaginibacter boryungensis]|uniref:Glycosyltransferase family 4 protein n=1 Tax=Mucilaginibacter boryungensis TaxID=768480 RepID=A0ABR9XCM8_9SPHI|nr:glycosyltransferase family 1 protein [Mucilaginibacter boryungensis]MBE9664925.1 glycosyltransferase family 4 protein [Mucilaginibacter boryungensis]
MSKPKVLVTFDSMKDTNCGYFSFGKGLGDALLKENGGQFDLQFYLFPVTDYFDGKVTINRRSKLHDLYFSDHNQYDLIHLTDQRTRLHPSRLKAKKIMTIHDINKVHINKSKPWRIRAFLNQLRKKILAVDRVVAISRFVADDVMKYIPEARDKMSVIHNGADQLVVPTNHTPAYVPGKPFLFTIGLLSPQKGFHLIPPLLQGNDYQLVIAGMETPHKQTILDAARQYGVADRVIITGPITEADKAWYYQHCAAFVFPSRAEGFGLPVIEAMHFGKPVFLSRYTSLPEVGGSVAYYFDELEAPHMQQVFTNGMLHYAQNNRAPQIIAHAGQFTWENAAKQYLAIYSQLLGSE